MSETLSLPMPYTFVFVVNYPLFLLVLFSRFAKDRQLVCKRPSITTRKTANRNAKGREMKPLPITFVRRMTGRGNWSQVKWISNRLQFPHLHLEVFDFLVSQIPLRKFYRIRKLIEIVKTIKHLPDSHSLFE